ncbi:hypothetical protein OIDMADRAFT_20506 [Oidiodendron maius Zn]|uniref:Uncharacterized protein n=1 Tax=Oidiodendron maius (strain Zn) TaxID=913774 RepID=A0A0C3GMG1_OIDMZ|nr:hypothetical protein OIDMADRAFT_20506 [Oidiodendron maius Zn]
MMSDTIVYNLARSARQNLRATALCEEPDLRRLVGHANMLDGLITELLDLGYEWNDNVAGEQIVTITDRPLTSAGHVRRTGQALSDTATEQPRYPDNIEPSGDIHDVEDSSTTNHSDYPNDFDNPDNTNDWDDSDTSTESDESEQSDLSDTSHAAFVEMFEEYGNKNTCYAKYILITMAQSCKISSPDMSLLVTIQEVG